MPVPVEVEHREAPERLPEAAETPWKSRVSSDGDPSVRGSVKHPEAPVQVVMVRPDGLDESARGDQRGRNLPRRTAGGVLRRGLGGPGTTAVGPGPAGSSACRVCGAFDLVFLRVRGCRAPWTSGCRGAAMHHGLPVRKGVTSWNPRSGSGPSESAGPEGEQSVEGARNPRDGRCRARHARVIRIPPPMSL